MEVLDGGTVENRHQVSCVVFSLDWLIAFIWIYRGSKSTLDVAFCTSTRSIVYRLFTV